MRKIVHVSFDVEVPDVEVADEQIDEWLRFELNDNGTMWYSPLTDKEVRPIFGTFHWRWL
jgi:hypothetical protein